MSSFHLILSNTMYAALAAVLFFAGCVIAPSIYSRRIEFFMSFPRWLMGKLQGIIASKPSHLRLTCVIFGFNGTAIFVYMLTGILPGFPFFIAFVTGLNVTLAALIAGEEPKPDEAPLRPPLSVRLCTVLTFSLELPCFWYAIGMGYTMPSVASMVGGSAHGILSRIRAYGTVILPVLLISAAVESYAVLWSSRRSNGEAT